MDKQYNQAFTIENKDGKYPIIFTVEHAEKHIPEYLNNLGLEGDDLERHIAWDIGIKKVCQIINKELDIPTIYGGYSRLVCEINRDIKSGDDVLFPSESDGTIIPGNQNITDIEKQQRIDKVFKPYYEAAQNLIKEASDKHHPNKPIVFTMHSFTDMLKTEGKKRPWEISISTYSSPEILVSVANSFTRRGVIIGVNEPYDLKDYPGVSLDTNANQLGLPNILIEMRQDLISDDEGIEKWANIVKEVIKEQIN